MVLSFNNESVCTLQQLYSSSGQKNQIISVSFVCDTYDNTTIKAKEDAEAFVVLLQNNKITEDALQYL